jgi:hypothetical protein
MCQTQSLTRPMAKPISRRCDERHSGGPPRVHFRDKLSTTIALRAVCQLSACLRVENTEAMEVQLIDFPADLPLSWHVAGAGHSAHCRKLASSG